MLVVLGGYLAMSPLVVAEALGLPHGTSSQMINLRATWGGGTLGLGAFVVWLPALQPWLRSVVGLLTWGMAGLAIARAIGFVLDGHPDSRQYVWLAAEVAITAIGAGALGAIARRARPATAS